MSTASTGHHAHAHHFESAEHEHKAGIHGVWLFLVTEILMFSGLFVAYAIFKGVYPGVFHEGHKYLDWRLGATNTVVLLFSSLTMALSIYYIRVNQPKKAMINLLITIACGAAFMVIKYFEYSAKIHHGLLPGNLFNAHEAIEHKNLALFFSLYFCMTGLHGIHVLTGMCLIAWVALRLKKGEFGPHHYTAVEGVGLFWHLVDLIWIYLFPLMYLVS